MMSAGIEKTKNNDIISMYILGDGLNIDIVSHEWGTKTHMIMDSDAIGDKHQMQLYFHRFCPQEYNGVDHDYAWDVAEIAEIVFAFCEQNHYDLLLPIMCS